MIKTKKEFLLDDGKIKKIRKILGVSSDGEAVNAALDIVLENTKSLAAAFKNISIKLKLKKRAYRHRCNQYKG